MKKRKILPCLIAALTITCFAGSCENVSQVDDRVIVKEFGYSAQSMTSQVADVNNLEAVTELSSQVIKCEIVSLDDASVNELGVLSFKYSVKVLDIIMDINDSLEIGDTITVSSSEGIMKASEAAELMKGNATAKKLNILQGEYNDNEYITSSTWDAVPIEVGKTYIMFITDWYLESEGLYSESGRSFLFEYDGQNVVHERSAVMSQKSTDDIVDEIKAQVELRTGRVDEVGAAQYMNELGERQRNENQSIQG